MLGSWTGFFEQEELTSVLVLLLLFTVYYFLDDFVYKEPYVLFIVH